MILYTGRSPFGPGRRRRVAAPITKLCLHVRSRRQSAIGKVRVVTSLPLKSNLRIVCADIPSRASVPLQRDGRAPK